MDHAPEAKYKTNVTLIAGISEIGIENDELWKIIKVHFNQYISD